MNAYSKCLVNRTFVTCRLNGFIKLPTTKPLISLSKIQRQIGPFIAMSVLCVLSGCGGGGAGGLSVSDVPPVEDARFDVNDIGVPTDNMNDSVDDDAVTLAPSYFETEEYWGNAYGASPLAVTHFSDAYARGWTGKGSLIVIADTGIDVSHADLAGQIKYGIDLSGTGLTDTNGHGTHVAGIVAAAKNDIGMHGAAFDADLAIAKVTNGWSYSFQIARQAAAWGRDLGAVAINMSAAYQRDINFENTLVKLDDGAYYSTHAYHGVNGYYNSLGEAYAWKAALGPDQVLVKAAGNDGTIYSAGHNQMATATDDDGALILDGQMLIVGNWDVDGEFLRGNAAGNVCVTWVGDHCHDAAKIQDSFIMAPGTYIYSTYHNGDYAYLTGTSMAAPMVAGALAVVHQMWPHMSGKNLAKLLLVTADKTVSGYDVNLHGQGLLDMEKATRPYGAVGIPTTGRAAGSVAAVSGGAMIAGATPAQFAAFDQVMVLDSFERDFYVNLTTRILPANMPRTSIARAGGITDHYAAYFKSDQRIALPILLGDWTRMTLGAGMSENEFLGNRLSGSFGQVKSSNTAYINIDYNRDIFGLNGFAQFAGGMTHPQVETRESLLAGVSTILSSSWTVGAEIPTHQTDVNAPSRIGLAISQPVTIEQGQLNYNIPVARTKAGSVLYKHHAVDLKPAKRALNIASYYDQPLFDGMGHMRLYAEVQHNHASRKSQRASRIGFAFFMTL
ncbi:predicted subtilase [Candidatus Puniceispirillum marinum IMCC1322]|uniref:Predicted subtilase n=2 Tax=Candidatus Puniceispirillum TaxID=767891 RepID=D5BTJ8_PUNMI|nr:predicted subtilase [Candidatus Puniceispirillum marinum IMCC1322]